MTTYEIFEDADSAQDHLLLLWGQVRF